MDGRLSRMGLRKQKGRKAMTSNTINIAQAYHITQNQCEAWILQSLFYWQTKAGLPHRSGPPDLLARRFPRSGVHAATSPQ